MAATVQGMQFMTTNAQILHWKGHSIVTIGSLLVKITAVIVKKGQIIWMLSELRSQKLKKLSNYIQYYFSNKRPPNEPEKNGVREFAQTFKWNWIWGLF